MAQAKCKMTPTAEAEITVGSPALSIIEAMNKSESKEEQVNALSKAISGLPEGYSIRELKQEDFQNGTEG